MLMMILAAATATAAPQQNAGPPCRAGRILVGHVTVGPMPDMAPFGWSADARAKALLLSKTGEPGSREPKYEVLPRTSPQSKGPAVLMSGCKAAEEPRKKDYPMA
ncbi:MAG: hypothetical protein IBJ12_14845 [Sphingomonadaceae bacterium]|nr:hypothetical protein [Sphingomonadaceae bacterium]